MRSSLSKKKQNYPKLMISNDNDFVVLFTDRGHGFVVHSSKGDREIGFVSVDWNMNIFEDFNGDLTLRNE